MYHVQFVTGTNRQTGHLAERIRLLRIPVKETHSLTHGWVCSESDEMDESDVRKLLADNGIEYPADIPLVYGDYSISMPEWNAKHWNWNQPLDDWLPIWMQPHWWRMYHWDEFAGDYSDQDMTLAEWKAQGVS